MDNLTTTYFEAKDIIRKDLESMSKKFITIGYYLKYIRDNELYIQDGFTSIWEFAQDTYGISKSTCSRWMHMNDKFSEGGNSPHLKQEFISFGKSQLQEMLYLDDAQIEQAKPEMTAKEIREIRKPEKRTPNPEESTENLPGQMNIEDYPEILPEEVPCFEKGGESYGYTWYGAVKEYLRTAYTKDSAKIEFMGKEYLVLRRPERTFFYDGKGNTLFEVENTRLEEEYNWLHQGKSVAPAQQQESLNPITKIPRTMLTYIAEAVIDKFDIELMYSECENEKEFEEVARSSIFASNVDFVFCNTKLRAKFLREIEVIKIATGKEIGTTYTWKRFFEELRSIGNSYEQQEVVAPSQQENEVPEEIYTSKEWTPEEVLEEKREELHRWIALAGEEHPESLKKQKIIVDALEYMVKNLKQAEGQQEQPELPKFKNNDQRKEWLRNYQEWGIWYIDENIGAKYYRYQFENGAELIVEEYKRNSQYTGYNNSYYFHLVGGPKPPAAKYGATKWTRHETYSKFPSNETELVEFLKEIQK